MLDAPVLNTKWTLTIGQVAHLFGESEPTFRKHLAARLKLGFPNRLPGTTKWSLPAVKHWFAHNGGTYGGGQQDTVPDAIDEARSSLAQVYA